MSDNFTVPSQTEILSMCDDIKKICMPIFMYLTIRYFRVVRSYPDDTKFILCSNKFWLEQYFNQKFFNTEFAHYKKVPDKFKGFALHGISDSSNPVLKFWSELGPQCDYNTIIGYFEKNDAYLEVMNFGFSQDSFVAQNIFLNNQNLFLHFIQYFYKQAHDIMQRAYDLRFKTEIDKDFEFKQNWVLGLPEDYQEKIINKMPLEGIYVGDNLEESSLTKEEIDMIVLLVKGYNKKEILKKVDINKKDLQSILTRITEKLKIKSEDEIRREIYVRRLMPKLRLMQ